MSTDFNELLNNFYENKLEVVTRILYVIMILLLSSICEVGGGWMIWQVMREGRKYYFLIPGSIILIIYGFIMSFQMLTFSRAFATYGGVFILVSILWGWAIDKEIPDKWDWIGTSISIVGVAIIAFIPR